jgi:hypothetical protein
MNPAKCQLWMQSEPTLSSTAIAVPVSVAASSLSAFTVLGLPVSGGEKSLCQFATSAVRRAECAAADIANLHHAQGESVLLRACGPTSRLRHLLRFNLTASVTTVLLEADKCTLEHAARIIGRPPPPEWESVAVKAINNGGLGFELLGNLDFNDLSRKASELVVATLLGAIEDDQAHGLDSGKLQRYLEAVRSKLAPTVLATPQSMSMEASHSQVAEQPRSITKADCRDNVTWLREESARAPFASAFLHAAPGPGTTLEDAEFRDAVWLRLGLPAAFGHVDCDPPASDDFRGLHRLGCKAAADARLRRHDALATIISKTALSADPRAFQVSREARVLDAASPQSRPGDVALDLGDGRTYVDVTVVNAYSAAHLTASRSAGSPARAAEVAFDRKVVKYADQFDEADAFRKFVPLAVTALGVWDERSLQWLRRFSAVCAAASSMDVGLAFTSLMTRLSIALWRGNSRMMRAGRPSAQNYF